ncbi:Hypothetical predicted protein [Lynx pardinus]|uniref:40s ribosomal protein s29-like n=1 Tax=Lynx pardinus TaxID=191816 RepID=A0A485NB38_LYNPA|nr:Hypothetical predicted protein [Lynx pardinus]
MGHQQLYWSPPRKFRLGSGSCRICSNPRCLIRKYCLHTFHQCFHQCAKDGGSVGWIK